MTGRGWGFLWGRRSTGERLTAIASIAVVVLALTNPTWPWFAVGSLVLLCVALIIAIPPARRFVFPKHPAFGWCVLVCLTWLFVVHNYYIELHRQRSERFDLLGVTLPAKRSGLVRLGVGHDSVDVRLERASDPTLRWFLEARRSPDTFAVERMHGVDAVQQQDPPGSLVDRGLRLLGLTRRQWRHVWGVELSSSSPIVDIRGSGGAEHRIELVRHAPSPTLKWGATELALIADSRDDPAVEVRNARLLQRLRRGIVLGELPWRQPIDTVVASNVVLTLVSRPYPKLDIEDPFNWLPRWGFRLTSRTEQWEVAAPGDVRAARALPSFREGDSIRVWAGGTDWIFTLGSLTTSAYGPSDLVVGFGRRPDPRLGWLPAADVCSPVGRCTLISSRALPPAVPHFDLSGFGIDTSRFSFIGRVEPLGDRYRIVTPNKVFEAPAGREIDVPLTAQFKNDAAEYRVRVFKMARGELLTVVLTMVALALTLTGVVVIVGTSDRVARLIKQDTIATNAAWAIASVAVVLMGLRLALGFRVTYAAPYHDRAAETAIGLWIAVILVTGALLRWDAWGPRVIAQLRRVEGTVRIRAVGKTLIATPMAHLAYSERTNAKRRRWIGGSLLSLGLGILAYQRLGTVLKAAVVILLVLLTWIMVEYLREQSEPNEPATSAGAILSLVERNEDWARWTAVMLLTLGIPLSVFARGVAVYVTFAAFIVLLLVALITYVKSRRGRSVTPQQSSVEVSPDKQKVNTARLGAVTVAAAILAGLNALLVRVEGPTLLFVSVFFLFLLAVRLGHEAGDAISVRQPGRLAMAVIPAAAALIAVVSIDFGLVLVIGGPLAMTLLLTLGIDRVGWKAITVSLMLFVFGGWLTVPVLRPNVDGIVVNQRPAATAAAFNELGGPLRHLPGFERPVRRSVVRALAAYNPELLERILARAAPSPSREQLIPAREQIWGGRAYATSGLAGQGLAGPTVIGRGVPVAVSDAENTFSVYVLAEHGLLGGIVVLAAYATLLTACLYVVWRIARAPAYQTRPNDTAVAVLVGGVLMLTVPAAYVAAANLSQLPLTGQNMPFLGLNAWSDVAFVSAIVSAIIAVMLDTSLLTDERTNAA